MKKIIWFIISGVLLLVVVLCLFLISSKKESDRRLAQAREEVEQAERLPRRTVKISTVQAGEGRQTFDFEAKVVELMAPAGLVGVRGGSAPCDAELDINVSVDALSGQYVTEGTGEISTRYTGARLAGTLELRLPGGMKFTRTFEADKPVETEIRGGAYDSPNKAPMLEIFWEHVVPRIADLLGEAFGPEILVRALMTADDEGIRAVHAKALARMGRAAVGPLSKALESHQPRVRTGAAWSLGEIGSPEAIAPLLGALDSGDEDLRFAAACSLTKLGEARGINAIRPFLGNRSFRWAAVNALASSRSDLAIDGLIDALSVDDPPSKLATLALNKRTGVQFGLDQQRWREWRRK